MHSTQPPVHLETAVPAMTFPRIGSPKEQKRLRPFCRRNPPAVTQAHTDTATEGVRHSGNIVEQPRVINAGVQVSWRRKLAGKFTCRHKMQGFRVNPEHKYHFYGLIMYTTSALILGFCMQHRHFIFSVIYKVSMDTCVCACSKPATY